MTMHPYIRKYDMYGRHILNFVTGNYIYFCLKMVEWMEFYTILFPKSHCWQQKILKRKRKEF